MRHLAMYNGHGCADVALANLGLIPEVTFSTEIDARACKIANYRHPHTVQLGDAFEADYTKLGHIDLLTGGSPCTYWTIAQTSHRETTCDGFGYALFMQYVRALHESKATYFLYENNASMSKCIKAAITKELGVEPIFVDSAIVSAQHRERLYWTNIPGACVVPTQNLCIADILEEHVDEMYYTYKVPEIYDEVRISRANTCRSGRFDRHQSGRVFDINLKSPALCTSKSSAGFYRMPNGRLRRLTPVECERLQQLPDGYTDVPGISPTARYHAIGNGWTIGVIEQLLAPLVELLEHVPLSVQSDCASAQELCTVSIDSGSNI